MANSSLRPSSPLFKLQHLTPELLQFAVRRSIIGPRRFRRLAVSCSAAIDTTNGALLTSSSKVKPLKDYPHGRQHFPLAAVVGQIILAREYLKDVAISRDQIAYLVNEALRGHCQGHRTDLYACRVAKCLTALEGRDKVSVDDLKKAVELVIIPRSIVVENPLGLRNQPPPPSPISLHNHDSFEEENEEKFEDNDDRENEPQERQIPDEFIFNAEGGIMDEKLLFFSRRIYKSRGKGGRAKNVIFSEDRGRYVKPMLPKGPVKRLAVDATLRAAAPYQKLRREKDAFKSKKFYVEKADMRAKRMARKAGALVIFVVDASVSMALNRMQNAKGAALQLLAESYISRDQESTIICQMLLMLLYLPPRRKLSLY